MRSKMLKCRKITQIIQNKEYAGFVLTVGLHQKATVAIYYGRIVSRLGATVFQFFFF